MRDRVTFATLGCRLNQVDTLEMQSRLAAEGFRVTAGEAPADVVVVNTCTVTGRAEASDRQAIRRLARLNPGARVVVTGCWAQTDSATVAAMPEVDLVVGNADKPRLAELVGGLTAATRPPRVVVSDVAALRAIPAAPIIGPARGRARAFLKVQEGCGHRCAFCIVPRARGGSRSQEPAVVVEHARRLLEAGHRELTLTGVDLGSYGADLVPRTSLAVLLRRLIELRGLRWVRLSSLLPAYLDDELVELFAASPALTPHVHVPLQSGSDRILRRMRRPYSVALFRRVVERLVAARPGLGLGTDVIVGHPGEGEDDFAATLGLVAELPFTYLHVFPYAGRPGTEAAALPGRVAPRVAAERSGRLRALGRAKNLAFRRTLVGGVHEAVVLGTRDRASGRLMGLTGHYIEVLLEGGAAPARSIIPVRVTGASAERTWGEAA